MKKWTLFVFLTLLWSAPGYGQEMLTIKGSDTMAPLVQKMAEAYLEDNPDIFVSVTGGGSGTGVAALLNRKCGLANSSRAINKDEAARARANGVYPVAVIIALDGVSIIVHGSNPVEELTAPQIAQIFRGEIKNWKELGGDDMPIGLYGRPPHSGTHVFFRDEILKADYPKDMLQLNGNADIVDAVRRDTSAIGYVGVGYLKNAKDVHVIKVAAGPEAEYISPLDASAVQSGRYPFSRPLFQYVHGKPDKRIKSFLLFELGEDGQRIVEEEGFIVISETEREFNRQKAGL
ncbi:MAG TPA: PstS family phosphate ABC transporter substrate-binding protein [Candidatus Omnitrophota bacterium]|nr:PstS family phosphate ABC transporter substrate-binding protein [Candidatus Omnitrophota bacterium]HPN55228.1 PstS family phosphate ABC transporter substrate-binding protein [Candidatus Omnitrophota bacterium]